MAAKQQAHSSSDDTVIDSDSTETWGISSGDISDEEIDPEEVELEESDAESYSDWVNGCYNYFSTRRDNSGQPLVATREECQLL